MYHYIYEDSEKNPFFIIQTLSRGTYKLEIIPDTNFQDASNFNNKLYHIVLYQVDTALGHSGLDKDLKDTVIHCLGKYLEANKQHILCFTPSDADGRDSARYRKFSIWFSNSSIQKINQIPIKVEYGELTFDFMFFYERSTYTEKEIRLQITSITNYVDELK